MPRRYVATTACTRTSAREACIVGTARRILLVLSLSGGLYAYMYARRYDRECLVLHVMCTPVHVMLHVVLYWYFVLFVMYSVFCILYGS